VQVVQAAAVKAVLIPHLLRARQVLQLPAAAAAAVEITQPVPVGMA